MKYILLILFFIFTGSALSAAIVSGTVKDKSDRTPLANVTIGLKEIQTVVETDNNGLFRFENILPGEYSLVFSHESYGKKQISLRVKRDINLEVFLDRAVYNSGTIGTQYNDLLRKNSINTVSRKDIKKYPLRGVGDSLHLLQTLPGVGSGFSLATVPIIRGVNPLFNKYYVDSIPIDYPYHYAGILVPLISSINEESFDSAEVIKGKAPLWTGDNLGNTVMLTSREPEDEGYHATVILDPLLPVIPTVSFTALPRNDLFITGAYRRSAVDWFFDAEKTDVSFEDYFFKTGYTYGKRNRFTLLALGAKDVIDYSDLTALSGYDAGGLTWEYLAGDRLFIKTVVSTQKNTQKISNSKKYIATVGADFQFNPAEYRIEQTADYTYGFATFEGGWEVIKYTGGCEGNVSLSDIAGLDYLRGKGIFIKIPFDIEGNSYASFARIKADEGAAWGSLGGRYESYTVTGDTAFTYSAQGGYRINRKLSVFANASSFAAHPDMYYYLGNINPDFTLAKSRIFSGGANYLFKNSFECSTEIFHNSYRNLSPDMVLSEDDERFRKIAQVHPFSGESDGTDYGGEIACKGSWGKYSGWTNYSWITSQRTGSAGSDFESEFSQSHIFRLALSTEWNRLTVSAIENIYTPLPYTPVKSDGTLGDYNSARSHLHTRFDLKGSYQIGDSTRIYFEWWNVFVRKRNYVCEKKSTSSSTGLISSKSYYDTPVFVWFGLESKI